MPDRSPLPRSFLTPDPGIGGRLKVRPEDFMVEEVPLYDPNGQGEHLYLGIQKQNVSHGELIGTLRRFFGVPERAIGFAGMKDKRAVTRQTISVQLHEDPPSLELPHDRIAILWAERHRNKLRRGHLQGNRFVIRIRDVDPVLTPRVHAVLRRLEETGVPCYYGEQRFGYRHNNHLVGGHLLRRDPMAILDELLGARGTSFPPYQQERRELYDAGRYADALEHWTRADRAETILLSALSRGADPRNAIRMVGRSTLNFWASSFGSAVFNALLDRRIEDGLVTTFVDGDIAWKHLNRSAFRVTEEDLAGEVLQERLDRLEISPSGPRWGNEMMRAGGAVAALEREALEAAGGTEELMDRARYRPEGGRRPYRAPITNVGVEGGFDEHGPYIRCTFDLPRGMYATIALREVMKTEARGWRDREDELAAERDEAVESGGEG